MADLSEPNSRAAAGGGDDAVATMARAVGDLSAKLTALHAAQRTARRQFGAFFAVVVLEAAAFVFAGYSRLRDNFSDDRVAAAIRDVLPGLTQDAGSDLGRVLTAVAPVYRDEASRQFQILRPRFEARCTDAYKGLLNEVADDARRDVQVRLARVLHDLGPDVKAAFPTDAAGHAIDVLPVLETRLEGETLELARYADGLYRQELARVRTTLGNVGGPTEARLASLDKTDLEWELVQKMIRLADLHLAEIRKPGKEGK